MRNQKGLSDVTKHIDDLDKVAALELRKIYNAPGCIRGWLLWGNDVLVGSGRCFFQIVN